MKMQKTRAIVLRRTNYGEADRVIQIITPMGKRSVIAKGVRREKSKLAGGIELFAVSEVVIGKGLGDLDVLTSARLVHFYRNILKDYGRLQFGYLAIKLVSKASEMLDEPEWYDVLSETLAGLDSGSVSLKLTETWFYLRYASLMGYELSLQKDIKGEDLSPDKKYRYDISERGLTPSDSGEITSDHIKLLRLIATKSLKVLVQIGGVDAVLDDCRLLACEHAAIQS
jgi:DNA repair protein RecO (recombination protein O)